MKKNILQKGFTLIELLVVVAIIAILSGTILVALNRDRAKAKDARIQAELQQLKSQMELYYTSNGGYGAASSCSAGAFTGTANNAAGTLITGLQVDTGAASNVSCYSTAEAWAVSAKLISSPYFWCSDSNGRSATSAAAISSTTSCPF